MTTSSTPANPRLRPVHRLLIAVIVTGAVVIAGIGFAGSYAAVRALALKKGFGDFSYVFPIGIDAGICVLLALDLLLTWIRIPFPLLRQTAWLLTAATIAFNGAAAWPDPLGVGMHAVIPVLFVVSVEAARHAIGRIADITADKHMEGVRLTRWLLSPIPTFLLWRRMKLWELRSYEQVIKLEQDRLVYQAHLHSRFGRAWRRKAPVESLMPLRLARYGVPLAETAPSGLAAAGIEPVPLPPAPQPELDVAAGTAADLHGADAAQADIAAESDGQNSRHQGEQIPRQGGALRTIAPAPSETLPEGGHDPVDITEQHQQAAEQQPPPGARHYPAHNPEEAWQTAAGDHDRSRDDLPGARGDTADAFEHGRFPATYRNRLADHQISPTAGQSGRVLKDAYKMSAEAGQPYPDQLAAPVLRRVQRLDADAPHPSGPRAAAAHGEPSWEEFLYNAWQAFAQEFGHHPDAAALSQYILHRDGVMDAHGRPLPAEDLSGFVDGFWQRQSGDTNPGYAPAAASAAGTAAHATEQGSQPSSPVAATQQRPPSTAATPQGKTQEESGASPSLSTPTAVDHYYLVWHGFQQQHGKEPNGAELSAHLAERNVRDREGQPIKPKALTRYFLEFRIYTIWADHREHSHTPAVEQVAADLAQRGIAAQYNRPIQASDVAKYLASFERRWNTLAHHRGAFPD